MLVRLFGSNFRSFKDPFELSMVAADLTRKEDRDRGVIEVSLKGLEEPLRLLRVAAIFGANASGKSNILTAARALRWLATESSGQAKPDADIPPYEPFMLADQARDAPVTLGCDVVHEDSILRYEVVFGACEILTETLTLLTGESEITLIDRRRGQPVGGDLIDRSDANRLYVKEMQPTVTVLSKLAQHGPHEGEESALPYYKSINQAMQWADYSESAGITHAQSAHGNRFADDSSYREWIMHHLIRPADVGIREVSVQRRDPDSRDRLDDLRSSILRFSINARNKNYQRPGEIRFGVGTSQVKNVFVSFVHEGDSSQEIGLADESAGTRKLFNIATDWWQLAEASITLWADELGASLHPRLQDRLIRAVNEPPANDVRSQLIFATHDTGLLEGYDGEPPALRRDQVYFTKKDAKGASELYSLTEFKDDARPVHNIRKRYLSGLYGAIPSVEKLSL